MKKHGIAMTIAACLWLGLFPLLQFFTYQTITHDKWVCMLILTGITVVCLVVDALCGRTSKPGILPLICGGCLLLWIVLSCVFSPYTDHTVWTNSPWIFGAGRREGLVTQLCYFGIFFLFSFSRVRPEPVKLSAGVGVVGFFIVAILQRTGGNPLGLYPEGFSFANAPHFQGTIGHVDMGGGYLSIMAGLILSSLVRVMKTLFQLMRANKLSESLEERRDHNSSCEKGEKLKFVWLILYAVFLLAVFGICVFLLLTIDADLGVLTLMVLLVWTFIRCFPKKFRLPIFAILLAVFLLVVWFWPNQGGAVWELHEIFQGRPRFSFGTGRLGVWVYCFTILREDGHLLLGTGADTFALRFQQFLDKYYLIHPDAQRIGAYFDTPHNDYLALIMNNGILAVILFLVLVIAGIFGMPEWGDSVLCYGIQVSLAFSVCIVAPMFWTVLGLAFSMPLDRKKEQSSKSLGKKVWKPEGKRLVVM